MKLSDYLGVKSFTYRGRTANPIKFIEGSETVEWQYDDMVSYFSDTVNSLGFKWDRALTKSYGNEGGVVSFRDNSQKIHDKAYNKKMQKLGNKMGEALKKEARVWAKENGKVITESDFFVYTFGDTYEEDVILAAGDTALTDTSERMTVNKTIYDVSVHFVLSHNKDQWETWEAAISVLQNMLDDYQKLSTKKVPRSLYRVHKKGALWANSVNRLEEVIKSGHVPYPIQNSRLFKDVIKEQLAMIDALPDTVEQLEPSPSDEAEIAKLYPMLMSAREAVQNLTDFMNNVRQSDDPNSAWEGGKSFAMRRYLGKI